MSIDFNLGRIESDMGSIILCVLSSPCENWRKTFFLKKSKNHQRNGSLFFKDGNKIVFSVKSLKYVKNVLHLD